MEHKLILSLKYNQLRILTSNRKWENQTGRDGGTHCLGWNKVDKQMSEEKNGTKRKRVRQRETIWGAVCANRSYRVIGRHVVVCGAELCHQLVSHLVVGGDSLLLYLLTHLHGEMPQPLPIFLTFFTTFSTENKRK